MEASDTSGTEPTQDPGSTGQDTEQAASSQESAAADSNLTTPQPDQPIQTEAERNTGEALPTADGVQGQSAPPADSAVANEAEARRQQELNAAQREHAQRTGGGDVQDGELQQARQEHNDRTGGGQVPGADSNQ